MKARTMAGVLALAASLSFAQGDPKLKADISKLSPTQFAMGHYAVALKVKDVLALKAKGADFLKKYLKKKRAPVVLGPGGKIYVVDHHHTINAFFQAGITEVYIEVIADYSKMDIDTFWAQMIDKKYAYLMDANGNGPIDPRKLPSSILNLPDNPYRSLAGLVQDAGGFEKKKNVPYYEFRWAEALRKKVALPLNPTEKDFKEAVDKSLKLIKKGLKPPESLSAKCLAILKGLIRGLRKHAQI